MFYESIASFYDQSATITTAMFYEPDMNADIAYVYGHVYKSLVSAINPNYANPKAVAYSEVQLPAVTPTFMTQEPLYNLVPYKEVVKTIGEADVAAAQTGAVSGAVTSLDQPVNSSNTPWVTIKDNSTGQLYCLAVYNGTVNQYIGPCKYDEYH
jgi:hypothetical protein